MPKLLVIVESPAKAKTIKKFLGKDFDIRASVGHVRDLPTKGLGVDIQNNFKPEYVTIRGKEKIIKELRDAARTADRVLLATDPDREGEAIAWHVASQLDKNGKTIARVLFHEITPQAVQTAIQQSRPIDMMKVNAQQARRVMDRIVGYQVSPFLWKTLAGGLSAGRVQSVALRLISEREEEIIRFVAEEYWTVTARVKGAQGEPFEVRLVRTGDEKTHIPDEKTARALVDDIRPRPFVVDTVKTKEMQRHPQPPFITSTLQQDAARRLRFTTQKTMMVAQQLYEGLELGPEGSIGLITYMRTDSTRVADEAVDSARTYIAQEYGADFVPPKPRRFKTKEGAQDAHEAIRPTSAFRTPQDVKTYLTPDQFRLYELVWRRFVASQMKSAVFDVTTVDVNAGPHVFRATGSTPRFAGFLTVYGETADEDGENEENGLLPPLAEGERLALKDLVPKQHFTQPPPRYTEATLVKELEARRIGRPSTYAQIISTLRMRKYVTIKRGRFSPSDLGNAVNHILVAAFPNLFDVEFTARMEDELDRIETGDLDWVGTLTAFYQPFNERLQEVNAQRSSLKQSLTEMTDETCEKCGKPLITRWGRNGRFLACSGYPGCRNTRPLETGDPEVQQTHEQCDKCGTPMVVKKGRFGTFLACSAYPTCQRTRPVSLGIACPETGCGGYLTRRRSQRGRTFYGCSKYPTCKFVVWDTPVAVACPSCTSPIMVEKTDKPGAAGLQCPRCHHRMPHPHPPTEHPEHATSEPQPV
ncbi:MAG: type I DNA topoisomerase [candidate division Zixibacteria bacterium]|nr:type I DNA topoisomerase [candidate division Zixibacteria bacterium]